MIRLLKLVNLLKSW